MKKFIIFVIVLAVLVFLFKKEFSQKSKTKKRTINHRIQTDKSTRNATKSRASITARNMPSKLDEKLYRAALKNDLDAVKEALAKGANIDYKVTDLLRQTPLIVAVLNKNLTMAKFLLEKGANIDAQDKWNLMTPLHWAVNANDSAMIKLLIAKGANINIKNKDGVTAPELAKCFNLKREYSYMMKHGKKGAVIQCDKTKYKNLISAIRAGRMDAVKYLLANGADINKKGVDGTCLHAAVLKKDIKLVKFLIAKGVNIKIKNSDGMTAFQGSIWNPEIMRLLIAKGANVNVKDNYNHYTPLHLAVSKKDYEMAKLLIAKGADINAKDKRGKTALDKAIMAYNKKIMKLLIEKGANVKSSKNVLLRALNKEDPKFAAYLITKGANVNVKGENDNSGITALHIAVMSGYPEVVELMLKKGADVNAKDSSGRNAIWYARYAKPTVRNKIMALLTGKRHGYLSPSQKVGNKTVTITGRDITLKQALLSFKHQTNLKIKIHKGVDLQRKMSGLNLKNYSVEKILHWIGKMYKVRIKVKNGLVHVYTK